MRDLERLARSVRSYESVHTARGLPAISRSRGRAFSRARPSMPPAQSESSMSFAAASPLVRCAKSGKTTVGHL